MCTGGISMNSNLDLCVDKITKKSKGLLSDKEAKNFLVKIYESKGKNIEAGIQSFEEAMSEIDIDVLQKKKIARVQKANLLKSFLIKKQQLRKFRLRKPESFQDVKDFFNNWFRQAEKEEKALEESFTSSLVARLDEAGLREEYDSHAHADDIIEELHYQQVRDIDARPNQAVGGNKNNAAFKIARILDDLDRDIWNQKRRAGSAVGYLEGRAGGNAWESDAFLRISDEKFLNDWRQVKRRDGKVMTDEELLSFKRKVESKNHNNIDEYLATNDLKKEVKTNGVDIALSETANQKFEIPPEKKAYFAKTYMGGDIQNIILKEWFRSSTQIANMSVFGSNPEKLYNDFLSDAKAFLRDNTKIKPERLDDSDFFQARINQLTRNAQVSSNERLTQVFDAAQSLISAKALGSSVITSIVDPVNQSVIKSLLTGEGSLAIEGLQNFGRIFGNLYKQMVNDVGEETAQAIAIGNREALRFVAQNQSNTFRGLDIGLADKLDGPIKFKQNNLFADLGNAWVNAGRRTAQAKESVANLYNKFKTGEYTAADVDLAAKDSLTAIQAYGGANFKMTGLDAFTENMRAHTYAEMSFTLGTQKDKPFAKLTGYFKEQLFNSDIDSKEWDFIRTELMKQNPEGTSYLEAERLLTMDVDKIQKAFNTVGDFDTREFKDKLFRKTQGMLLGLRDTGTLISDIADKGMIQGIAQRGSVRGELAVSTGMFRSYSAGFLSRILKPLLKHGSINDISQIFALSLAINTMATWGNDLVRGKTPRDMRQLNNLSSLVARTSGLPFADTLTGEILSEGAGFNGIGDILAGPLLSEVGKGIFKYKVFGLGDLVRGDLADFEKNFTKASLDTAQLALPFTNNMLFVGAFRNLVYNNIVNMVQPTYKDTIEKFNRDRGQETLGSK